MSVDPESFLSFYQASVVAPYLLGVSGNALIGAVTAWKQQKDATVEQVERAIKIDREHLKPLIQRIEEKLLNTLASLPYDEDGATLFARRISDPVFVRLLAEQISFCRIDATMLFNAWVVECPELDDSRQAIEPFLRHYLEAVSSVIASDAEILGRLQMKALGEIGAGVKRLEIALVPPTALVVVPAAIPPVNQIHEACLSASKALLHWPTSIEGERIESPVFAQLIEERLPEQPNVQLLLGEPGSGKSALLAQLGRWFLDHGHMVLAIKADQLSQSVHSLASLGVHLGLGETPGCALVHLSETGPVIVLIDQLDALADLVDLHGGRLNAALQLIRELGGTKNLRVIASCREVECRHDARLAAIDAEPVQLPLPTWDEVQALLVRRGVPAKDWPEAFREILRRPQQLAVLVKLLSSGEEMPVFTSYQQMLEKLWLQCVTNAGGLPGRAELLRDLARQMARDETHWLARARYDDRAPQVEQLLAGGILTTAEDARGLGFQHQTVFDFALARSFASDGQTLTEFVMDHQQSLFVRPRLWSALVYLRGAEPHTYRREFAALWQKNELRYHVRLQLVEFLGQLEDPDHREEGILREALAAPELRETGLIAIAGRRTWLERLAPDVLPKFMAEGTALAHGVAPMLSAGMKFNTPLVLSLLRDHWISQLDMDWWTITVMTQVQLWNAEATTLAETLVGRDSGNDWRVSDLISVAAETDASQAVAIFSALLRRIVAAVESQSGNIERKGGDEPFASMFQHSPRQGAANEALRGNNNWPDLNPIAEAAPAAFIGQIWPLFLRLLDATDDKDDESVNAYRREFGLGLSIHDGTAPILEAIDTALEAFARSDVSGFTSFLHSADGLNSLTVQRILARSLAGIADQQPLLVLDFLLADPRRLRLGDYDGENRDSGALIAAVCPHLNHEQIYALEQAIGAWEYFQVPPLDIEPETIERWTRTSRLRLWKYIPECLRSKEVATAVALSETKFPELATEEGFPFGPMREIKSPMSPAAMEEASDCGILAALALLPDSCDWRNPEKLHGSSSIEMSRAFAEFAKKQPERAIGVIHQLDPSTHTRPAAYALEKLVEAEIQSERLFGLIQELDGRGFQTAEFRGCAADAVSKSLAKGGSLPEDLFAMLQKWLPELVANTESDASEENSENLGNRNSLLWDGGYSWTVPQGSYTVLSALDAACRADRQPDRFLAVLRTHLKEPERVATWRALCWHFQWLGGADRQASAAFLLELFQRYPDVRDSAAGARAIATALSWLPAESARDILEGVRASASALGRHAYGELLMYRNAFWNDVWASAGVSQLLEDPATPQEILAGLATTAAHTFSEPRARDKAAAVLRAVIPRANDVTATAVLGLFDLLPRLDVDSALLGVLGALHRNPCALVPDALGSFLERLPDLIPAHSALAADIADTILDHHGSRLLDMRTSFAGFAGEFINLALTLHRDEGVGRSRGLNLFESLLILRIDGARQSLFAVDSRPVAGVAFRPRRRSRRVPRVRQRVPVSK